MLFRRRLRAGFQSGFPLPHFHLFNPFRKHFDLGRSNFWRAHEVAGCQAKAVGYSALADRSLQLCIHATINRSFT